MKTPKIFKFLGITSLHYIALVCNCGLDEVLITLHCFQQWYTVLPLNLVRKNITQDISVVTEVLNISPTPGSHAVEFTFVCL